MLNSLADAVQDGARGAFALKGREEGQARDGWLVVDFGDIVVHLFSPEQREYYRLEQLWDKGKVLVRLQ